MPTDATPSEVTSPTRSTFKVQKSGRPSSSRKQSYDVANIERMDSNNVRVNSFIATTPQGPPINMPSEEQKAWIEAKYNELEKVLPSAALLDENGRPRSSGNNSLNEMNGFGSNNGTGTPLDFGHQIQNPLNALNGVTHASTNGMSSRCAPKDISTPIVEADIKPQVSSCCGPQQGASSNSIDNMPLSEVPPVGRFYYSPTHPQDMIKNEPMMTPLIHHQMPPQPMVYMPAYPPYAVQPTMFPLPAAYGSFQNPVQPDAWRQNYGMPQVLPQAPAGQFGPLVVNGPMHTIHNCACGLGCQCLGCAAHPYNETTQIYMREAMEDARRAAFANNTHNNHAISNGGMTAPPNDQSVQIEQNDQNSQIGQPQNGQNGHSGEINSSPTAQTPTSTTSQNGEEQVLSGDDFLFVNYEFTGNCGGDQYDCPCGDDCQCIGCVIHNDGRVA
jgi:hypothetical protein